MSIIGCHLLANETETPGHAMDMHIDGKQGKLTTEQQDTGRCFWPNPLKTVQPLGSFFYWKLTQKIEIQIATFLGDFVHDGLNTRCFDLRPVDIRNRILHFFSWCIAHRLPRAKSLQKIFIRGCRLFIACTMREKDID